MPINELAEIEKAIQDFNENVPSSQFQKTRENDIIVYTTSLLSDNFRGFIRVEYSHEKFENLDSNFRIVAFISYDIGSQEFDDKLLSEVIWTTFYSQIQKNEPLVIGGSISKEETTTFRDKYSMDTYCSYDIRATWVPKDPNLSSDLFAFFDAIEKTSVFSNQLV